MIKILIQTVIIAVIIVTVALSLKILGKESPEELAETVIASDEKCKNGDKDACEEETQAKAKAKELTAEEYIIYMTKLGLALDAE